MSNEKTIRMPKELLDKWLAALRSGEYRQGRNQLRSVDSYCCLGVLMAVATDSAVPGYSYPPREFLQAQDIAFFDKDGTRRDNQPWMPTFNTYAGDANDEGKSFAEIADAIELHAEGV